MKKMDINWIELFKRFDASPNYLRDDPEFEVLEDIRYKPKSQAQFEKIAQSYFDYMNTIADSDDFSTEHLVYMFIGLSLKTRIHMMREALEAKECERTPVQEELISLVTHSFAQLSLYLKTDCFEFEPIVHFIEFAWERYADDYSPSEKQRITILIRFLKILDEFISENSEGTYKFNLIKLCFG